MPVFAFFAAGIPVSLTVMGELFTGRLALGVLLGLVVGRLVGASLVASLLAAALLVRGSRARSAG